MHKDDMCRGTTLFSPTNFGAHFSYYGLARCVLLRLAAVLTKAAYLFFAQLAP